MYAEACLPGLLDSFDHQPLHAFYEQIVPILDRNDGMTLAKLAARNKLSLSKTVEAVAVTDIRWVPDLTSDTLTISREYMAIISQPSGLPTFQVCNDTLQDTARV